MRGVVTSRERATLARTRDTYTRDTSWTRPGHVPDTVPDTSLGQAYYRGAMGILLLYDVTNAKSLQNVRNWVRRGPEEIGGDVGEMRGRYGCAVA